MLGVIAKFLAVTGPISAASSSDVSLIAGEQYRAKLAVISRGDLLRPVRRA